MKYIKQFESFDKLKCHVKDSDDGWETISLTIDGAEIGELTMEGSDDNEAFTIIDSVIYDKYRGNGYYKHLIYYAARKHPKCKIYSAFRSDEADRAWKSLIKKLPNDIKGGHKIQDRQKVYWIKSI